MWKKCQKAAVAFYILGSNKLYSCKRFFNKRGQELSPQLIYAIKVNGAQVVIETIDMLVAKGVWQPSFC